MDLIVVRHAIAFDRDPARWPEDGDRPLSPEGVERFRRVSRALRRVAPRVDVLYSSPFARAWQTAGILEEETGWPAPQRLDALLPDRPLPAILPALRAAGPRERVAVVGHEPHLHELIGWFVAGPGTPAAVEMKKGGAALLSFISREVGPGAGRLEWLLPPRVLLGPD